MTSKQSPDEEMEQAIQKLLNLAERTQRTQDAERLMDAARELADGVLFVVPKLSRGFMAMSELVSDLARSRRPQNAMALIEHERWKQIELGYDASHDDTHRGGELAIAADCYLNTLAKSQLAYRVPLDWPFEQASFNLTEDRVRQLVLAASFIAAEIDRLLRQRGEL